MEFYGLRKAAMSLRISFLGKFSSCSQILTTVQPLASSLSFAKPSLSLFLVNFLTQNARLLRGTCPHLGHWCQKQPSTKTATRLGERKTKSGLPGSLCFRRHPVIPASRIMIDNLTSVERFPEGRIFDINADLWAFERKSTIVETQLQNAESKDYCRSTLSLSSVPK